MKKFLNWMLAAILIGGASVFTSCIKIDNPTPAQPSEPVETTGADPNYNWSVCNKPTFFGSIDGLPEDLMKVLKKRFPNQTSIDQAEVALISMDDAVADFPIDGPLQKLYDRNGLLVVFEPRLFEGEIMGDFSEVEDWDPLIYAANIKEDHYTMLAEKTDEIPDVVIPGDGNENSQYKESLAYSQAHPEENDPLLINLYMSDNTNEFNENYWDVRMNPFIDWIEEVYESYNDEALNRASSTAAQPQPTFETLTASMKTGTKRFEYNFPFLMVQYVDKALWSDADILVKNSSISFSYQVLPMYAQSSNGENAGDYYAVIGKITPHNDSMWGPYVGEHGGTRNRVYGFWMKEMQYKIFLANSNGLPINDVRFQAAPYPENVQSARENTNTFSAGINGSVKAGGSEKNGFAAEGSVGFSANWTETIKYTLNNIDFARNTSTSIVDYTWKSNNVKLDDDMSNIQNYFPDECHKEFDAKNAWLWHVPYGTNGIEDGSTKQLYISLQAQITYSCWHHWRGTATFDSNRKDKSTGVFRHTMQLPAPDRTPWGIISVKNASKYTMRKVKIYKSGQEDGEPLKTINNSYEKNEIALTNVNVGRYTVTFEHVDPDNVNKVVQVGTIKNVEVKQGKDMSAAKTELSTADAEMKAKE